MSMRITSKLIKTVLIHKFRFVDGFFVTSEASVTGSGGAIADLLVYDYKKKSLFEIEIKISKQDLLKDLQKPKHKLYEKASHKNTIACIACITKFYYAVPTYLVESAKKMIQENNLPYGVIELHEDELKKVQENPTRLKYHNFPYSSVVKIVKRPKKLYEGVPHEGQLEIFYQRMSSELASSGRRILELEKELA